MDKLKITLNGKQANLLIDGGLWNWSENDPSLFRNEFAKETKGADSLDVYINTAGGDIFVANELYNIIKSFKGNKTATLGAICASAGTTVACACDTVKAMRNTNYMVHNPQGTFEAKTEADFETNKSLWKSVHSNIVDIYADKTGLERDKIEEMMANTTWMSAKEAKEKGFIDEIEHKTAYISNDASQELLAELAKRQITAPTNLKIKDPVTPYNINMDTVNTAANTAPTNDLVALQEQTKNMEATITLLKNKLTRAGELVAIMNSIAAEKIPAFVNLFTFDPEAVFGIMEAKVTQAFQVTEAKLLNLADHVKGNAPTTKKFSEMTISEKQELKNTNLAEFDRLFNEHLTAEQA